MEIRKYVWLTPSVDFLLIAKVRELGVRHSAQIAGCTPSHVVKWLKGHTGMDIEKVNAVMTALGWTHLN